jgi:plasmid stability protein/translation initiation factor 2 beta subunit (eIF-2beta)/eIF-5
MAGVAPRKTERSGTLFSPEPAEAPEALALHLEIVEPDLIDELTAYAEGDERDRFAIGALRIGILALRQARGRVDADVIGRETGRLLAELRGQLTSHAAQMHEKLAGSLKEYFDPESGRFHERVQQLIREDGDLEQLLRRQIGGEDSELCKTLLAHFGQQSPLMKLLSPHESHGLLQALRQTVETQLAAQRDHVLREFSLDNKEGALARMIGELTASHGQLTEALEKKIGAVAEEFSLDKDDSALSRLVKNVEGAKTTITREFSLDDEHSALSRMKGELTSILEKQTRANATFQEEVKVALAGMAARREEAQRSTRHGVAFEDAVCSYLEFHAQQKGDIATRTGATTGMIKNCKIGDCVVELGPDSAAPGASIVVEAKEDASYTLSKARAEVEQARKNRGAQMGLFVFSKPTAPEALGEFVHFGSDVFVVWDPEDTTSDLYLRIGLAVARALCIRAERHTQSREADFEAITEAILEIEKQSQALSEVTTSGETIRLGAEKILKRVRITRQSLERQVEALQERIADLQCSPGAAPEAPA